MNLLNIVDYGLKQIFQQKQFTNFDPIQSHSWNEHCLYPVHDLKNLYTYFKND